MNDPASALPPPAQLIQLLMGKLVSQAICAVAELGIADHVEGTPVAVTELAERTQCHAGALHRLLRALASVGIFQELGDGQFGHTPLSECLKSRTPGSVRSIARMIGAPFHAVAETELLRSIRTGQPAFEHVHGMAFFEYLGGHPEAAAVFDAAMTDLSRTANAVIVASYDFSSADKIVDVGGGHGSLLEDVLEANPGSKGVLFDLPSVVRDARESLTRGALASRAQVVAGNFLEAVPAGGDVYLLKYILHDWDDAGAEKILKACSAAMAPTARLLIVEDIVPAGNSPSMAKLTDLEMLAIFGGLERKQAEYERLLSRAAFNLIRVVSTPAPLFLIVAEPASRAS